MSNFFISVDCKIKLDTCGRETLPDRFALSTGPCLL